MNAKDAIRNCLNTGHMVTEMLLADLADDDLLVRSSDGANHFAWQLGHLIAAERHFLEMMRPDASPSLPDGFAEKHGKENTGSDAPADFLKKQEYLDLYQKQREATVAVLEELEDADLDKPAPESMAQIAKTWGDLFMLAGTHELMHTGQLTAVRRKIGKPNAF